jgi:hypothetical protein
VSDDETDLRAADRTRSRSMVWRVVSAALLLGIAVGWPVLDVPSHGPTIVSVTYNHGVDLYDLGSLVPLALAVWILWPLRRRR